MSNIKTAVGARGFYMVGEGNDGAGKTTQIELLAEYLEKEFGLEVFVISEPGGTPFAEELRAIIKDGSLERSAVANLLLFTVCRYEAWHKQALPVLNRGGVVLSSRNYLSSVVYQGIAEGLGAEYVEQVTAAFMDKRYVNPDMTVIFSLDSIIRQKRLTNRNKSTSVDTFESRDKDYQDRLDDGYTELARRDTFVEIDAGRTIEQIQKSLRKVVVRAMVARGLE